MNKAIEDMLQVYDLSTELDWVHAIREITQEIALLGLWRSGFFNQAALYGGTALRIFHGLNRFSEDLDFSLSSQVDEARLESFLPSLEEELTAWGFSFDALPKASGERTGLESVFLKGNSRINLLKIGVPEKFSRHFPHNQKITIKLELDIVPPPYAQTEVRTHLLPTPFQTQLYDLPSMFAGKLHAVLFRDWKSRVKGRDFYDFVWFIGRSVPVNLPHLAARMLQSGNRNNASFDLASLKSMLNERFDKIDIEAAAEEVRPFLRDSRELDLWSESFFKDLSHRLVAQDSLEQSGQDCKE